MMIPLDRLADALEAAGLLADRVGVLPVELAGVSDDSRTVVPGDAFVAVRGSDRDGHDFIESAIAAGAALVIVEDPARAAGPALVVREGRRAAALVAAAAQDWPARSLRLVGITGTNGKTTTANMLRHLLDDPSSRAASIGTLGVLVGSEGEPLPGGAGLTTPGPVELQRVFRDLVTRGVRSVAMEVSSHALDQHRVDGVELDVGVFTNLTRDHLDYHGSMERYLEAKARLVTFVRADGALVVNLDEPSWAKLGMPRRRVTFGERSPGADVRAEGVRFHPRGSDWTLVVGGERLDVRLPLIGDFNVCNALGAAAAAHALGLSPAVIASRLSTMPQVPGRLELVSEHPAVLRDYAHTPDALERALRAVRPFAANRVIAVFGCGGDRDRGKRPEMGAIASRESDVAIVTSDNPRTEDPERILDDIEAGMTGPHERIEDRRAAIARAIDLAGDGDVVLLAGKGHETYQIRGTTKLPFDEKVIVAELVRERGGRVAEVTR